MEAISIDPFRILLNNISNELEEKDLQNLKNVCAEWIPSGQREQIKNGWDLLNHLRRQNIIGEKPEMVANLLLIIKVLQRRDLIQLVEKHITKYYQQAEEIFNAVRVSGSPFSSLTSRNNQLALDLQSSGERKPLQISVSSSRYTSQIRDERCCCGCSCSCDACCNVCCDTCCISCSVFLVFLFSILAIVAILAWYSNIPGLTKYLKSNDDIQHAGPYVIGISIFLALSSFVCAICVKCCGRRNAGQYEVLEDIPRTLDIQESYT